MAMKGRKHMKKYTKKQRSHRDKKHRKYTRNNKRHNKKHMKGGMRPLNPESLSAPIFVPKGVPFVPPGGGAQHGDAFPHKYYSLAQPSLHAPNNFLQQGGNPLVQLGRSIMYNIEHMYNTYRGDPTTINQDPNVLKQPIEQETPDYDIKPLDVNTIQKNADAKVADFKPYGV